MSYRMSRVVFRLLLAGTIVCSLVCPIIWMMSAEAVAQAPAPSNQKTSNAKANSNSEEAAVFERILNRVRCENDGTEVSATEAWPRIQIHAALQKFPHLLSLSSPPTLH